jgi:hypothetical protein
MTELVLPRARPRRPRPPWWRAVALLTVFEVGVLLWIVHHAVEIPPMWLQAISVAIYVWDDICALRTERLELATRHWEVAMFLGGVSFVLYLGWQAVTT